MLQWFAGRDESEMRSALREKTWDVVIADYRLPQFDAPHALRVLQESGWTSRSLSFREPSAKTWPWP